MRLAQQDSTSTEYFLPDALGSVRQLVDETGTVTLAQAFQPYGETLSSAGTGNTAYGYTGEWTDSSGLVNLRARYYAPGIARFMTRDPWNGDAMRPMSYNPWLYVYANPINLTDPSGKSPQGTTPLPPCLPAVVQAGLPCTPVTTPPPPLPYCFPLIVEKGLPCIPVPCWGGPGEGWLPPDSGGGTPNNPLPDVPPANPGINPNHWGDTVGRYTRLRAWFQDHDPAGLTDEPPDPDGYGTRFTNETLIAFFLTGEFHTIAGTQYPIRKLAFAALFNVYNSHYQCGGNCDSVIKQLTMLSNSEGWYDDKNYPDSHFTTYYSTHVALAQNVLSGTFQHATAISWGNYTETSLMNDYITDGVPPSWWNTTQNGPPYLDFENDENLFPPGLGGYAGFVVMNRDQNNACDSVGCLGW